MPAVVVALELDDDVAAGRPARDPQRQLDGLAAGVGEAGHLGARHQLRDEPRGGVLVVRLATELDAADSWRVTASTTAGGLWPRMIGPGTAVVVDQAVAVDIEQERPVSMIEDERGRPEPVVAGRTAREVAARRPPSAGAISSKSVARERPADVTRWPLAVGS